MRTEPICCGNAPPIARHKTWKTVFWPRSTQIVADRQLMLEKLSSDHRADRVASTVFGPGLATPVAVEPRHGIGTARLQFSSYDVSIDYGTSVSLKSWRSRAVSATSSSLAKLVNGEPIPDFKRPVAQIRRFTNRQKPLRARQDSNLRPPGPEPGTLSTELRAQRL